MFPGYKNMDPCSQHLPHLREHIPYPYYSYPNWESRPLHMKMDSSNYPSACGPWPYNNQVEHHNCCNHNSPPGCYGFRPPYFHCQHPPQMYYHGPCPPYHDAYPPFFIPSHFDHGRFDYENDKNHCCGCPNHISHRKDGNNVIIEEQKATPTINEGTVTVPKGNHSSLIQYPYNYYPMMLLPDNGARDGKNEKFMESLPVLNFKDNLKDLREGQGGSANQGDKRVLQLPYPILWLPGNDKPEEAVKDKKEIDATRKIADDLPSKLKIVPLKLLDNEKPVEKPEVVEEEAITQHSMDQVAEKESKVKTIPVVHLDSVNGEKPIVLDRPEDVLKNSIAEEKMCDVVKKTDTGKKQPFLSKASKLPPVCLRVDPLPKKNGSKWKSGSPCPPILKEKDIPHEGNKGHVAIKKKDSDDSPIKDIKVIDVKCQPSDEGGQDTAAKIVSGQGMKGIEAQCGDNDRKDAATDAVIQVKGNVGGNKEEKEEFSVSQQQKIQHKGEIVDLSDNTKKKIQKKNSQENAALLIQSAFRGFNVRRWKPLEKLGRIAQIREKVTDVKSQIQNYENSLELDVKQKVIISETIMNLLLQLDTIQGLLPSLREVRKSVARDLVCLQDKLDQLCSQGTKKPEGEIQKKEEITTRDSAASDITSPSVEKTPLIEKILSGQLSPYLKEEYVSVQESGGSSVASAKTSCASDEYVVQEPVGQSHIVPIKMLNDEMVPCGDGKYATPHQEDENVKQDENLLSADAKASIDENSMSQDVVAIPPQSEVSDIVLKADQSTNCKKVQASKEPDLNDLKHNSNQENPSISLLEQQISVRNEPDKQSSFEEALKAKLASEEGIIMEEGSDIKPDELITERNEEAIVEESNVMHHAFVVSGELKPAFNYADVGGQLEMHPNQPSNVEKDETQVIHSVKEDSEMNESLETVVKLCVGSAASTILKNDSLELAEANSKIPPVDTSIDASIDVQGGVDFLEAVDSRIMYNETGIVPEDAGETSQCANNNELPITSVASACKSGLKETASNSSDEMGGESNLKESSQHDKYTSDSFYKEKKLVEENEMLWQMLEKILHAGQEQMVAIADLNERVKNLERKPTNRKKVKVNRKKICKLSHSVVGNDEAISYEQIANSAA